MQTDLHAGSRIVLGRGATDSKRALVTLSLVLSSLSLILFLLCTYLAYHYSYPTLIEQLKVLELSQVKKGWWCQGGMIYGCDTKGCIRMTGGGEHTVRGDHLYVCHVDAN